MEEVSLNLPGFPERQETYQRLVDRKVEMLDIFCSLSDVDQERMLVVIRAIARAAGPLPLCR